MAGVFDLPSVNGPNIAQSSIGWDPQPYPETASEVVGAHLGNFRIESPVRMTPIGDLLAFKPRPIAMPNKYAAADAWRVPTTASPYHSLSEIPGQNWTGKYLPFANMSWDQSTKLAYGHWGVGEKGPASRAMADWLGTYQDQSRVDPHKAANYASIGGYVGIGIPAYLAAKAAFMESPGDPFIARGMAGLLGAASKYPLLGFAYGMGKAAGAYLDYRESGERPGRVLRAMPFMAKELISYPLSKWLGKEALRYPWARRIGEKVLGYGSNIYSKVGGKLGSEWFTNKAAQWTEDIGALRSAGNRFIANDLEGALGKKVVGRLTTVFQELADPVVDLVALGISTLVFGKLADVADARHVSHRHAYKHAGVGEKGPSSRTQAEELGTYRRSSIVDAKRAAAYAEEVIGRLVGQGRNYKGVYNTLTSRISKYVASGAESTVFETKAGSILKISKDPILAPGRSFDIKTKTGKIGELYWAMQPKANLKVPELEMQKFIREVEKAGLDFVDRTPGNVGMYRGKPVLLDQSAVGKMKAPQYVKREMLSMAMPTSLMTHEDMELLGISVTQEGAMSHALAHTHSNMEQSGSMVRAHLSSMTRTYEQKSRVNPLKAALLAELELAVKRPRKVFSETLDSVMKKVLDKYAVSKQEVSNWVRTNRLSSKLRRRGVNLKEVKQELQAIQGKSSVIPTEQRVFLNRAEKKAIINKDKRQIQSMLSGKEYSNKIAYDNMTPKAPKVYGKKETTLHTPQASIPKDDVDIVSEPSMDTNIIQESKRESTISPVKSHVHVKMVDGPVDMKRLDRILTRRLKGR